MEVPGEQPIPLPQFGQQGDASALTFAPYVVDRVAFSSQWQAFVGARLDTLDYEDPLVDTERNDTQLSPLLGLVFSPSNRVAFHVSAGTSFAPPSTTVVGPRDPETSRQIEGGLKLAAPERQGVHRRHRLRAGARGRRRARPAVHAAAHRRGGRGDRGVFYGAINVYLEQAASAFATRRARRALPASTGAARGATDTAGSVGARELGALTVSVLQGDHGHQTREPRRAGGGSVATCSRTSSS